MFYVLSFNLIICIHQALLLHLVISETINSLNLTAELLTWQQISEKQASDLTIINTSRTHDSDSRFLLHISMCKPH